MPSRCRRTRAPQHRRQAPDLSTIKLIDYDFKKYGSSDERKRLLQEVGRRRLDAAAVSPCAGHDAESDHPSGSDLLDRRRVGRLLCSALVRGRGRFLHASNGWSTAIPFDDDYAPALFLIAQGEKLWLAPLAAAAARPAVRHAPAQDRPGLRASVLILAGAIGFAWLIAQGFGIGMRGWSFDWLTRCLRRAGRPPVRHGLRRDAAGLVRSCSCSPKASPPAARSTATSSSSAPSAASSSSSTVFVFFPIVKMLAAAFITEDGGYSAAVFASKFFDDRLWGLGCLYGATLRRRLELAVPRDLRRRRHHRFWGWSLPLS